MGLATRLLAATTLLSLSSFSLYSQDRDLRAERILIDDDNGERILLIAPHPMPAGSSYSLTLPDSLPPTDFVLMGNSSGAMTALEPSTALNTVSWLRSGNSLSDPMVDFIGTTDSTDLAFRTNGIEQMRITALGDLAIGTTAPGEARLHVAKTFEDTVSTDPVFGVPLSLGLRVDVTNPAIAVSNGVYVGSAGLSSVTGADDMSGANQFIGGVGVTMNSNTGGTINGLIGMKGEVFQMDPGASSTAMSGAEGAVQVFGGTVQQAVGVVGGVQIGGGSASSAAGLSTILGLGATSIVTDGYGLLVRDPQVDPAATLTTYVGIQLENIDDSGATAIRYDGTGSNVPFIVEGDGDVGIGTATPGEARLRVTKTFSDSIPIDPFFNEPIAFAARVDATSPAVADSGAIYAASTNFMFVQGTNDMYDAETFLGSASLAVNRNTGGAVKAVFGLVGQGILDDAGAATDILVGALMSGQVVEGTASGVIGGIGSGEMLGGTADMLVGLRSELSLSGTSIVANGVGVYISEPNIEAGSTLTDFTGLAIGNLSGTGYAAMRYDGPGPFVIEGDGDVGIGDGSPDARLDVENNDPAVPALVVTNSDAEGTGLEVAAGGVILSYASGAPATIPLGTAVFDVNDNVGSSAPTIAVPATGTNGQILYIYVSDPDGATVDGNARAAGDRLTYIYAAGGWQLFHAN